jgi:two-component system response regulator HydG
MNNEPEQFQSHANGANGNSNGRTPFAPNGNHQARGATVCLVDDDPSVLKATGRLLTSAGWDVECFTDPKAFVCYATKTQPKIAVLDIWMPEMSGLEVQTKLRAVSPKTRVVVLTSHDDPAVRTKAMEAGAAGFFLKPVSDDEFLARIESLASRS